MTSAHCQKTQANSNPDSLSQGLLTLRGACTSCIPLKYSFTLGAAVVDTLSIPKRPATVMAGSQETGHLSLSCPFALPCENSDSIEIEPSNAMQWVGQGLNQRWMNSSPPHGGASLLFSRLPSQFSED